MEYIILTLLVLIMLETSYAAWRIYKRSSPTVSRRGRLILLDTSVLIDGRIVYVAQSGFVSDTLAVPRSVIGELQFLADNADHEKRARARYGLDVIKELQDMEQINLLILQDGSKAEEGVDERLLSLAKQHGAAICTIDYNLNKVAAVEGITVLNINELSQLLRMAYLPGEKMTLELVQKGQDSHQGVGYLPDGTMVVVDQASKLIGQKAEIEFIRSLQTSAGKMMFAKLIDRKQAGEQGKPGRQQKPQGKRPASQAEYPQERPAEKKPAGQPRRRRKSPAVAEDNLIELVKRQ